MEHDNPAAAEVGTEALALEQWVVFACSGRRLAVPLHRIQEILVPRPFTRLPGSSGATAGLIGVRSRIVTAYDVGLLLGAGASAAVPDHRVLLAEAGEQTLGLVVDEVLAAAALPLEESAGMELVVGTADWDGVPVEALALDRLVELAQDPDVRKHTHHSSR